MACGMYFLKLLDQRGVFFAKNVRVLDIGTQNLLSATDGEIKDFVTAHGSRISAAELALTATRLADRTQAGHPEGTTYLGELLDLTAIQYESVDICPGYRTRIFDLNFDATPTEFRESFDVVLNFGTTEHVFNQYNSFKVIHEAAKPGGYIFHQLPSTGYCDHCYFLYNPLLFLDLAEANRYELLDLWFTGPQGYVKLPETVGWTKQSHDRVRPDSDEAAWRRADIPNAVVNVLLRKTASGPFRLKAETSTSSTPLDESLAERYTVQPAAASAGSTLETRRRAPINYVFITPVWGAAFVRTFTEATLPAQLTPGNLGTFRDDPGAVYRILTRSEDRQAIEESAAFRELSRLIRTEITLIDDLISPNHYYTLLTDCYNRAIELSDGARTNPAYFFLTADCLWSDGAFQKARARVEGGKRAVMVQGLRVNMDTFEPELRERYGTPDGLALVCPPRELTRLALEHLHLITTSMTWNGDLVNRWAAALHWRGDASALLTRSWVLHPMLVHPEADVRIVDVNGRNGSTVDHLYVKQACACYDDVYIVTDSDELVAVEMSSGDYRQTEQSIYPGKYTPAMILAWLLDPWVTPYHHEYVKRHLWFHAGEIEPTQRRSLEQESDRVIALIEKERLHTLQHHTGGLKPMVRALKRKLRQLLLGKEFERRVGKLETDHRALTDRLDTEERALRGQVESLTTRVMQMKEGFDLPNSPPMLRHGLEVTKALSAGVATVYGAAIPGHIAEFGTMTGVSAVGLARAMATCDAHLGYALRTANLPEKELHLFDSFCGLPDADNPVDAVSPHVRSGVWGRGTCAGLTAQALAAEVAKHLPSSRVRVFEGWFRDTLPNAPETPYGLIHIDSDLYISAMDVLDFLFSHRRVADGALLFFDDWNCNGASPEFGERKAWREIVEKYRVHYSDEGPYALFSHKFIVHEYSDAR